MSQPRHFSAEGVRTRRRHAWTVAAVLTAVVVVGGLVTAGALISIGSSGTRTRFAAAHRLGDGGPTSSERPSPGSTASGSSSDTRASAGPGTTAVRKTPVLDLPAVRAYFASRPGNNTAALYDLSTGTMSTWRGSVQEDTASIVKVDILETLLHRCAPPGCSLDAEQQELATEMIEQSDNDAATDLWDEDGAQSGVAAYNALVPLAHTTPNVEWGNTMTTAANQVTLLRNLAQPSRLLRPAAQAYALNLMRNVIPFDTWGVTAGVPKGVSVALKNGWLPLDDGLWQTNSIGWVRGDGRDYILAVLSNGNSTEGQGIATIQGLSAIVWAHSA